MPVRRRLLLLAFSLLIPAVIACGTAALFAFGHERGRSEENLLRAAQALAQALDRELDAAVLRLQALATSPALQQGDLEAFWQQARRAVPEKDMWVVLDTPDGQQVVNTLRPFGEPLPKHQAGGTLQRALEQVLATRAAVVSDEFTGPVSGEPTLAVYVPVFGAKGEVLYVMAMGIKASALGDVVAPGNLPEPWIVGALDRRLTIVARSANGQQFAGQTVVPELGAAMKSAEHGVTDATSREGKRTRVAFATSPKYGWHLAIGVPRDEMASTATQTVALFLGIAVVLLAGGGGLAWWIGRRISRAITSLVPAAHGLGDGERVAPKPTGVLEVDQVSEALVEAGRALRSAELCRTRAEQGLKSAKERAEHILSSIGDGFYALDGDWRFAYINPRAQELLGKVPEQVLGASWFDVFPEVQETVVHRTYREVMATRQPRQFDLVGPVTKRWTAFSVYPGAEGGVSVYFRDISSRKAAEAELVAAKDEAERANLAKTQFLAAASHDLRQPVQSLFFLREVLALHLGAHPLGEVVRRIDSALKALKSLLDGLLDISRLHAGAIEVQETAFPLDAIFSRLEAEYAVPAEVLGIRFRMVRSRAWVTSDMAQLERILRNLLDNALKYTGAGGRVLLGCRHGGGQLRIEIVDTGPGIPPDKREAIFDEFVQLGNPERDRTKGLGLGLAIVRHLGRLLGHEVTVRSRPGHGTVFAVTVPRARRGDEPPAVDHRPQSARGGVALVIDDETMVLRGLRAMLEHWGWQVMAADSGAEAVGLVEGGARAPDVIVADYRLRDGESGVTVIRDLRGVCGRAIPALVLTGDTSPERLAECQDSGFRLLNKPIAPDTLQAALAEMLAESEAAQG